VQNNPMIYGYARVSTDGQSVTAQVAALRKHGAGKVFREVASGAETHRAQLRRVINQLDAGDVLMVTRLDRLGTGAGCAPVGRDHPLSHADDRGRL
jgi:DNA invertase Pin-like site-specific DNA recombinase